MLTLDGPPAVGDSVHDISRPRLGKSTKNLGLMGKKLSHRPPGRKRNEKPA
jgi:hypothetical protein